MNFDRIQDAINRDREKERDKSTPKTGAGSSPVHESMHDSSSAKQTNSTGKSEPDPEKAGAVDPASVPSADGSVAFTFNASPMADAIDIGDLGTVQSQSWQYADVDASVGMVGDGERQKIFNGAVQRVRDILSTANPCATFFVNSDVALKALNAFAAKATIGIVDSLTNKKTGIEQKSGKKDPTIPYNANGTPYDVKTQAGKSTAAYRVFGTVTVNNSGPFFDKLNTGVKIGGYDSGFVRSQVLQILHELAHTIFDKKGQPIIVSDGSTNGLGETVTSENNTEIVKQACLKEIEASGKR